MNGLEAQRFSCALGAVLPTYNLRLSFVRDDGADEKAPDLLILEEETDAEAIATAKRTVDETYGRRLHSADLRSFDGRGVWSLRSPEAMGSDTEPATPYGP